MGAGIAGLAAAALISGRGFKVLVLEAHDRPGGYCSCWTRPVRLRDGSIGRFVFDAGVQDVSGLGPKGPLRWLLRELAVEHRLDWRRVFHRYHHHGFRVDVPASPAEFAARLAKLFPGDAGGIAEFFETIEAVHRDLYAYAEASGGVPAPLGTFAAKTEWAAKYPRAARWVERPFSDLLDGFVENADARSLLTTIAEYVTDEPDRLTAGEMAPLFGYYFDGGFYPAGGSQRLADVLCEVVAENGGSVRLSTRVDRVLVEDGATAGVVTARGEAHRAPIVIANSDAVTSLSRLIAPHALKGRHAQRLARLRRGPSAILVSLALDRVPDIPARVFLSAQDLSFGIGNPSVIDTSLAPEGHAALTLLCLVSEEEATRWFALSGMAYRSAKAAFTNRLIAAAETVIPGLAGHVLYRQTGAPPTFTRYALTGNGSIYGAARGQWCPPIKTPVPGLLLAGAACQNGPGIEAVVITGVQAANLVTGYRVEAAGSPGERKEG